MSSEVLQKINLIYVVLNQYLNESTEKGVLSINKSLLVLTKSLLVLTKKTIWIILVIRKSYTWTIFFKLPIILFVH